MRGALPCKGDFCTVLGDIWEGTSNLRNLGQLRNGIGGIMVVRRVFFIVDFWTYFGESRWGLESCRQAVTTFTEDYCTKIIARLNFCLRRRLLRPDKTLGHLQPRQYRCVMYDTCNIIKPTTTKN